MDMEEILGLTEDDFEGVEDEEVDENEVNSVSPSELHLSSETATTKPGPSKPAAETNDTNAENPEYSGLSAQDPETKSSFEEGFVSIRPAKVSLVLTRGRIKIARLARAIFVPSQSTKMNHLVPERGHVWLGERYHYSIVNKARVLLVL